MKINAIHTMPKTNLPAANNNKANAGSGLAVQDKDTVVSTSKNLSFNGFRAFHLGTLCAAAGAGIGLIASGGLAAPLLIGIFGCGLGSMLGNAADNAEANKKDDNSSDSDDNSYNYIV